MAQTVYLIDGSGYIFRAFHALPPLSRSDGTPVGAVLGFTNMLLRLLNEENPDHICVIFDAKRENFRNAIYPAYKANREETPPDLIPQFSLIREACEAFHIHCLDMEGYEADDLIATYAKEALTRGDQVVVVSSDKDLMQLVGNGVEMLDPMKNKRIQEEQVIEKFGVPPHQVVDVQALAGDKVDNVPGIPGIGVKTAAELLGAYGSLENLLERASEIKQPKRRESLMEHAEDARISKQLVTLKNDVPVTISLDEFKRAPFDKEKVITFLRAQSFGALERRLVKEWDSAGEGNFQKPPSSTSATPVYQLVQSAENLKSWIEEATLKGVVAVDTETTSLDAMTARLVGVSLATSSGKACYIPLAHVQERDLLSEDAPLVQMDLKEALALLKPLLEDESVLKIGQNLKYDMLVLRRYGLEIRAFDDTMVMSYVLDGAKNSHGMDALARLHLDHETIKYKDVAGKKTFDHVPLEVARDYAAEDADVTFRLWEVLKPRLLNETLMTVYETLERPLIPVLVEMEAAGIKVDALKLRALSQDFAARLKVLEKAIHAEAGEEFNVASPKQMGEILFTKMGFTAGKKGKSGALSTSASVLDDLAAEGHLLPTLILEWRQLAKLKSTYTDALIAQVNPETGRVHTSYMMTGTSTGRLSSSDPNLQNIPIRTEEGRKIRQAFVAREGYKLMSVDYSQIELRLLAALADIPSLRQAFLEGKDIHTLTASQVFGVALSDVTPELRRRAKAINFGIIYGISAFGLARQLGISREDAGQYIKAYFEIYPGIKDYMERMKEKARAQGYVETIFGRRCPMLEINDRDFNRRGFAERQAINAPLQGSNADIIKRAMIAIPPLLEAQKLDATLLLQVHDELVFEVREDHVDLTAALVKKTMEGAAHLSVPLVAQVGIGANWDEAH